MTPGTKLALAIAVALAAATLHFAIGLHRGMRRAIELQQDVLRQLGQLAALKHFDRLQQAALQLAVLRPIDDPESWQAARAGVLKAIEDAARDRVESMSSSRPAAPTPTLLT